MVKSQFHSAKVLLVLILRTPDISLTDLSAAALFQAEGYEDGDLTLYHSFTVTAFLKAENPVDFLGKASEVRSLFFLNWPCNNSNGEKNTPVLLLMLSYLLSDCL